MEFMLTPQEVFEKLCRNISKYESFLSDIPSHINFFGTMSASEKIEKWGFFLSPEESDFINEIPIVDDEHLYASAKLAKSMSLIREDVKALFEEADITFKEKKLEIEEPRANAINFSISSSYPAIESDLFFSTLLINLEYSQEFIFLKLKKLSQVCYPGVFGQEISTEDDDNLYKLVDDIDSLLINYSSFCCEEHGVSSFSTLADCSDQKGLNRRLNKVFGLSLEDIVK